MRPFRLTLSRQIIGASSATPLNKDDDGGGGGGGLMPLVLLLVSLLLLLLLLVSSISLRMQLRAILPPIEIPEINSGTLANPGSSAKLLANNILSLI